MNDLLTAIMSFIGQFTVASFVSIAIFVIMVLFVGRHFFKAPWGVLVNSILIFGLLLLLWPSLLFGINGFWLNDIPNNDIEKLGQYGDSFGALTAIFTASAFLVLCLTLIAQQEELRLQREELKKSRETFDGQKKVMALQLFETTLFNLLQQHHQILSSYSLPPSNDPGGNRIEYKGIHALRVFINRRRRNITSMGIFYEFFDKPDFNNEMFVLQNLYYNVCSLIEHVEEDTSGFIDKNKYKKIISRQLYLDEKVLLCIICWKLKDDNMKSLFWDYVFGKQELNKQELKVMGFKESLIQEINTYFNPNP